MKLDRLQMLWQDILPHQALSRLLGALAGCRQPWLKSRMIHWFIRHYGVDMSEATESNPDNYADFNSFFTRRLKPEVRPVAGKANTIISPADGTISQVGALHKGDILQAKGVYYDVTQLLGGSLMRSEPFLDGKFITIYLAPKDYHRVHMPLAGELKEMVYIPGRLFSVNTATVNAVPNLFARNERLVCIFETKAGSMAVVFVGAMLVASIHTVWTGAITPPHTKEIRFWHYEKPKKIRRAAELGHFCMGSTVIVLFSADRINWSENLQPQQGIRFGQELGQLAAVPAR